MDRLNEYLDLMEELEDTPTRLEFTEKRVLNRMRSSRTCRFFVVPAVSIMVFLLSFTVLVNASPSIAMACEEIPILKQLAQVVSFSPSLSQAVENEFIQPIELEQTENGVTVRVEYVIVDQKQLAIFYTLYSVEQHALHGYPQVRNADGSELSGYSLSYGDYGKENGELRYLTVDFVDQDMPDSLQLIMQVEVSDKTDEMVEEVVEDSMLQEHEYTKPEYACECTFILDFNPYFTAQGEEIQLGQVFEVDQQTLILETVEIYPTHMRINLRDVEENTAWLKDISFYVENEDGERFEEIKNGITATGSPDSPMMASHRLESSFFSESEELTLYITGVTWLDKDRERVKLDLINLTAEALPQGTEFIGARKQPGGWILTFSAWEFEENAHYQLWGSDYYDEQGNEYSINSWSSSGGGYWDEEKEEYIQLPGRFTREIPLKNYHENTVFLSPQFTRKVELQDPLELRIK